MVRFNATTLWHTDAAEWAPSTASNATDAKSRHLLHIDDWNLLGVTPLAREPSQNIDQLPMRNAGWIAEFIARMRVGESAQPQELSRALSPV